MRLAVFGKTGQVAQALSRRAGPNLSIQSIGRDSADFTDPDSVARAAEALNADAIINAVAYTAVDRAEEEPERAALVNAISVGRLAEVAASRGLPLVHISTDYVFDGTGQEPWTPNSITAPLGIYGRTKRDGEIAVRMADGAHAILRTSWVFSATGNNFVKTMLRLSEDRDSLNVVADQIGGPTSAAAIADATIALAKAMCDGRSGGTHHFSGAPDVSWADFAREIFRQADRRVTVNDIPTTAYPTPARRPLNSRLDCESLAREHGIQRPDWRRDLAAVLKELT